MKEARMTPAMKARERGRRGMGKDEG